MAAMDSKLCKLTTAITRLITTGTTEQALLAAAAQLFPNITPAELSAAACEQ